VPYDPKCILRTKKTKVFAALAAMAAHWNRTNPTPNADPTKTKYNQTINGHKDPYIATKQLLKDKGVTKLRKNGVLAIEYVLAFSPEYLFDEKTQKYRSDAKERAKIWIKTSKNWLIKTYGENCVSIQTHFDEKSFVHIHACIIPLEQRINKQGVTEHKLNARGITGGADKLLKMQDSYADYLINNGVKLSRGQRNSKAKHTTTRQFQSALNNAKKLCEENSIIPPSSNPSEFNVWQSVIDKLSRSLDSSHDNELAKLNVLIRNLLNENKRLQRQVNAQSRSLVRSR
jgi:hypothetical protein